MDLQLNGKTALVIGASQGIGRGISKGLAAEGVKLCIAARGRALLDKLAAEIVAAQGPQPHIVTIDIMEESAPQKLAQQALQGLGRIDILINSAGGSRPLPIDAPEEKWLEAVTFNFTRVRQLTHAMLPGMIRNQWGRIVNITGRSETDHLNAAFAAKAGVHGWAKGLSREIGKYGITINSISPGRFMPDQTSSDHAGRQRVDEISKREIAMGRYGDIEELANVAVFLSSALASYVTGTVISVDGGLRRYAF